jgi:hypothetical protein
MTPRRLSLLTLTVFALAACGGAEHHAIGAGERRAAIAQLATEIDLHYLDPAAATRIATVLRTRERSGAYGAIDNDAALVQRLTSDLLEASGDARLRVALVETAPWWRGLIDDAGIDFTRIGADIGYIAVRTFTPPARAARRYAKAFGKLADTNTIILDLRENRGGDADGLQLLASYVVDRPIHYANLAHRGGAVEARWAFPQLAARPYLAQLTILIGPHTSAEAENFAFAMQAWRRATVVGVRSAGVATSTQTWALTDRLVVTMAEARASLPLTGASWLGGVIPDVASNGDALKEAKRRILRERLAHVTTPMGRRALLAMLADL